MIVSVSNDGIHWTSDAQAMDTSGHQFSDIDDEEFFWDNVQLEVDGVLRPGTDALFLQKRLTT